MSRRTLMALGAAALLATASIAAEPSKPSCCVKRAGTTAAERQRCSLTGKVVDKCCCVERQGKTHCTLAGKDVEKCCCAPVKAEESAK